MPITRSGYAKQRNVDSYQRAINRRLVTASASHCGICHQPLTYLDKVEADHIIPVADGGTHDVSNLRAVHRSCNRQRGRG